METSHIVSRADSLANVAAVALWQTANLLPASLVSGFKLLFFLSSLQQKWWGDWLRIYWHISHAGPDSKRPAGECSGNGVVVAVEATTPNS
eukprot:4348761-Amphidinium_carterae.1